MKKKTEPVEEVVETTPEVTPEPDYKDIHESKMEDIVNNPNIDEDAKLELKTKLIDSLKIKRYCCKIRIMTFKQLTDIIK